MGNNNSSHKGRSSHKGGSSQKITRIAAEKKSKDLLVAAIDFGTTYSGWAVQFIHEFRTEPTKALISHWYSGSGRLTTEKAPTVVLIKPDGSTLEAFGYDAENKYMELAEKGEAGKFYYFRRFKMMLMKNFGEKITQDVDLEDEMGRRLPAITVFSLAIEYLVKDVHSNLADKIAGEINKSDVKWVITVPAIWTDPAKKFTRLAAEKAGISSDKLLIALEPECASIFCRYLPINKRLDKTGISVSAFPVGTKYMILDAGGGTVDITVHEVGRFGALKEITAASGGGWGGILVDKAFEDLLIDLIGEKVYKKLKSDAKDDWLDLWRDFELKKRNFCGEIVTIRLPLLVLKFYQDEHDRELSAGIKSSKHSESIKLKHDKMMIDGRVWSNLYSSSIAKIVSHVTELLETNEVKGIKSIIMVGAYSESNQLQERIKDAFSGDGFDVIIPTDASTAVLSGATIYGHNPQCIAERVSRYTFGFETCLKFIECKHPESKKIVTDSGVECDKCFDKHVEIGQVVKTGESQTSVYYTPTMKNQKSLLFKLYFSNHKNPEYTDEEGCWPLESFEVPLTDPTGDLDRGVYVSLTFSGTEIEAEGKEEKTEMITKAKFKLPD